MFSAPSMLMFLHPPRPFRRHTISKCRATGPLCTLSCNFLAKRTASLAGVINLLKLRNTTLGHHKGPKGGVDQRREKKTTGLFPKEAAIMDTVFMFILDIKFSPKFTCSQTKSKWMPPRRFFSSWARSSGHPLQVPKGHLPEMVWFSF